MKESWKAANELLNKRSKSSNIKCLTEAGTETVHKKGTSDAMNNFFCSIGKELADKIDSVPNPLLTGEYEVNANKAKFNFILNLKRSGLHSPRLKLQRALGLTISLATF